MAKKETTKSNKIKNTKVIKKENKSNNNSLYIVMPAYNEEETIETVIKDWYPVLELANEDSRIVIADNKSKDSTYDILKKLQKKYPKLDVIKNEIPGHGPTVIKLYKHAIEKKADYIFQTDSDGQTNPAEFAKFWNQRKEYDAILGNRVVRGDGKSRKFIEKTLCFILRVIFGVKLKDANAPYRLMNSKVVNKYVGNFEEDYNLPNVMLSTYFKYYNEKMKYEEITFKPRQGGVNSINIKKIIKIGWKALSDFRKFKKQMKKDKKNK